jgi:hypothetical protein
MNSISEFRRTRRDKGKKRGKYQTAINTAGGIAKRGTQIAVGGGLIAAGALGSRALVRRGYLPNYFKNAGDRAAVKALTREGSHRAAAVVLPAATVASMTVGADLAINRRRDLPVTRRVRGVLGGNYSANPSLISEFRKKRSDTGRKRGKQSPGRLSWKRKLSLGGHIAKGATYGAVGGGTLSALAASPIPAVIPAAAAIGGIDGAIKGTILGAATYGVRRGVRDGRKRKR